MFFSVIWWGFSRFRQICEDTAVEKRLPCVYVAFLIVTLLLIAEPKTEAQVEQPVSVKTLTLGVVYGKAPERVAERFRPLVEYTARKLAPAGEIKSTVIVANNVSRLIELVERAQVDFYLESPFPTYLINRSGTGRLLLRRWKGGMSEYRSVIFTSKASRITRLEDLRGKMIAFEDPGSTSGYFLPKLLLFEKRFRVAEKPDLSAKVLGAKSVTFLPVRKKISLNWCAKRKWRPEPSVTMTMRV
jgi:ABC-type phosphate/phosphonate transport system substrate-binding protein